MPGVKKIDIDKLEKTKADVVTLLKIAKLSKRPNTMRGVAIHRWIDGKLPKKETFEKWCRDDDYPHSHEGWASIRRLFAHWGVKVAFNTRTRKRIFSPHCFDDKNGFPWRVSTSIDKKQRAWVKKVGGTIANTNNSRIKESTILTE